MLLCMLALAAAGMALPTAGSAATAPAATDLCVGLECNVPASGSYVPEAQGAVPALAGLDELKAQARSGFYELPAPVYRGEVQPRSVVYLAKAGDLSRMPESVRNLTYVQDLSRTSGFGTSTFVVVDSGMGIVFPAERAAASARPRAKAAVINDCPDRYFCVWSGDWWGGTIWGQSGVVYTGTGWHNFGTNFGESMANFRDGDSLLADHGNGDGTRYCAAQNSSDATFSNNPIGIDNASSWAMLRGSDDRC